MSRPPKEVPLPSPGEGDRRPTLDGLGALGGGGPQTSTSKPAEGATADPRGNDPTAASLATWAEGVARLRAMPVPPAFRGKDWPEPLLSDAERFLADWGATAARLGWPGWALWGVHRRVPSSWRGRELVALLGGCPAVALTATEAVIAVRPGVNHVYCRPERDPLRPAERCLLWELA